MSALFFHPSKSHLLLNLTFVFWVLCHYLLGRRKALITLNFYVENAGQQCLNQPYHFWSEITDYIKLPFVSFVDLLQVFPLYLHFPPLLVSLKEWLSSFVLGGVCSHMHLCVGPFILHSLPT